MKYKKYIHHFFEFLFLFIGILSFLAAKWYIKLYGNIGFESILFTLTNDLSGMDPELIMSFLNQALIPSLFFTFIIIFLFNIKCKKDISFTNFKNKKYKLFPFNKYVKVFLVMSISLLLVYNAADIINLTGYLQYISQKTTIYEDYYVSPDSVKINFPNQKRNLLYIFLESMETTYFSKHEGGAFDTNSIPELYDLAKNNVNFSHNNSVGGFLSPNGSGWTVGAMVSQTSGIPLVTPFGVDGNSYGKKSFLPGVVSLNDILFENNYYQTLMIGSNSKFANRKQYYIEHKTNYVYDLNTARVNGIVPKDYYEWWGIEDSKLFKYAKQELTKISKNDQPFAFSLLTVDTHFPNGYLCSECKHELDTQYDNVLACSSRQVYEFIKWIEKQDFYDNTTIVICGDHLTMDNTYITCKNADEFDRRVYNCIINPVSKPTNDKNRTFTSFDLFPTTLGAMGVEIEGDRLALGTNLFSNKKTLAEELTYEKFNKELAKSSPYYMENFHHKLNK